MSEQHYTVEKAFSPEARRFQGDLNNYSNS